MQSDTTTIRGWVARDKDMPQEVALNLHTYKPVWILRYGYWGRAGGHITLDHHLFPEITWESEPVEVEITIKKLNNERN